MAVPIETFISENFKIYLVTLIIPFLIFFTLFLWALKQTRLFGGNNFTYVFLAASFTILIYALQPNTFAFLASYLAQISIASSMIVFVGLIALIFWAIIVRGVGMAEKLKSDEKKLEDLRRLESRLMEKFSRERNVKKRYEFNSKLNEIEREMQMLNIRMKKRARTIYS
ncbi:MAG: hypothetical protein HYT70_00640 [Candidatus Aenigmarchaeota archaeon]|nr:hypothetical protein [Candidatus Aenigmarchaeota archaeon]